MATVALATHAMACRFELILHGTSEHALRAAGEEAIREIERLEGQLSLYRSTSEIAHVNARAAIEPVRVSPPVFSLLKHAKQLALETDGAFDVTAGPLVRAWGFMDGEPACPSESELREILERTGYRHLTLDEKNGTVRFDRPGMMIDPGAIGKGYAIDEAVEILREADVRSALIHGGTSTVYAIGAPPDGNAWKIGIESAIFAGENETRPKMHRLRSAAFLPTRDKENKPAMELELRDEALSVSSPAGKYYGNAGVIRGHVIDPRTGEPSSVAGTAAVVLPSATESDALSTALLVLGEAGLDLVRRIRPGARAYLR